MADFQFQNFEDYIETLCTEHQDVLHDPPNRVAFSRLRSNNEISAITNNAGPNIVLMGRFNGRAVGEQQAQGMRQFVVLRFASYADLNGGDLSGGIDNAIDTAWNIMMQFIQRMRNDYIADDCGPLGLFEFENISWQEIDEPIYLESHYGWDVTIPFKSTMPEYDAAKWATP